LAVVTVSIWLLQYVWYWLTVWHWMSADLCEPSIIISWCRNQFWLSFWSSKFEL